MNRNLPLPRPRPAALRRLGVRTPALLALALTWVLVSPACRALAAADTDPSLTDPTGDRAGRAVNEPARKWIEDPLTPPWELPPDTVVASIDGETILKADLMDWATTLMTKQGLDPDTVEGQKWLEDVAPNILNTLITYRILKRQAEKAVPLPSDEEIGAIIQPVVERFGSEEKLNRYLEDRGFSLADYKEIMKQDTQFNRFIREKSLEFAGPEDISNSLVKRYYEQNVDQFNVPKAVKFQEIFLYAGNPGTNQQWKNARQEAEKVYGLIQAGSDMSALAMEYSDADSASVGGEMPFVKQNQIADPFVREALFQMEKGEISKPRRSRYGYYILKVLDVVEPHRVPLKPELYDYIRAAIREDRMKQGMSEWIEQEREKHFITVRGKVVNDPNANP